MFSLDTIIKKVRKGTGFISLFAIIATIALTLGISFLIIYLCAEQYKESAGFGLVLGFIGLSYGVSASNFPKLFKHLVVIAFLCFIARLLVFSFLGIASGISLIQNSVIFMMVLFITINGFGISGFCMQGILDAVPLKTVNIHKTCTQCKLSTQRK